MTSNHQDTAPPHPGRHFGMDWLRIGAFSLLILYHIGMYFVPWGWHVKAAETSELATLPMRFTNTWRLTLLFVVSGFASAALLMKLDSKSKFFRSRSARLLIPFVFGVFVIVPPQPWVELVTQHGYRDGLGHFWLNEYLTFGTYEGIILPTWNHLWFVIYLFAYTLWLVLLAAIIPDGIKSQLKKWVEAALAGPLVLLIPIAYLIIHDWKLFPDSSFTHALFDDGAAHARYFPAFLFGFILFRSERLWDAIRKWWIVALVVSLTGYIFTTSVRLFVDPTHGWPFWLDAMMGTARMMHGWGAVIGLIGLFDRFFNQDAPARKMLNEAVFPFYIAHQTIIVLVGFWLLPLGLNNWAAFAILLVATAGGCWLFYRIGREVPVLRMLIGLKGVRPPKDERTT